MRLKSWIPTFFNIIRIILTPFMVYLILTNSNLLFVGIVFVLIACTDMFDGVTARYFKVTNDKGARLDQVADRIFFTSVVLALLIKVLIVKGTDIELKNLTIFLLLLSREIVALPAFLYLLIKNKEFVKVRFIGKITTVLQAILITGLIIEIPYIIYAVYVLGFFGILSGITYWYDVAHAHPVKKIKEKYKKVKRRVKERIEKRVRERGKNDRSR